MNSIIGKSFELPPGPRYRNPFGTFVRLRERGAFYVHELVGRYGDLVHFKILGNEFFVVNDPDEIRRVMSGEMRAFQKDRTMKRGLGRFIGKGLSANDGASWKHQRQLIQPALSPKRLGRYADVIARCADRAIERIQPGVAYDFENVTASFTMDVVTQTMFGVDLVDSVDGAALKRVVYALQREVRRQLGSPWLALPPWVPTPGAIRSRRIVAEVDRLILGLIANRRAHPTGGDDLLSLLLEARDEDGNTMSDTQLRDELVTMFLAGHDTSSYALCWLFYKLAEGQSWQDRLRSEVARELGDAELGYEEARRLGELERVSLEVMRLYPPGPLLAREALEDVRIGNSRIPRGAVVLISPYAVHRHPRYHPDPTEFRPERFDAAGRSAMHPYAYIPFGAGPRRCIAMSFSLIEMQIFAAAMLRRFRTTLEPGQCIEPEALITMRPKYGLMVRSTAL